MTDKIRHAGFPAHDAFEDDPRIDKRPALQRVYKHLRSILDFREIREVPAYHIVDNARVDRSDVFGYLDTLEEWGYLIEHPRERPNTARRFTLAWSVSLRRRPAA